MRNVVILGAGCAGWTAALYTARAHLKPLLFAGDQPGGQLSTTTEVENFPGFPEGIQGPELMARFEQQARRFGTEVVHRAVTAVDFQQHPFRLWVGPDEYQAQSVIVCTGASPRRLGIPGELELIGYGVSTCATCDGPFFRGQTIGVIGGGDSAAEEATFLTRFAEKVYLLHRRDRLRASPLMTERVLSNEKIEPLWNSVVTEIIGSPAEGVTGVHLQNTQTGEESSLDLTGVFIAIGHLPNTDIFRGQLELDEAGYIVADRRTHTNIPGVFAAGDVVDRFFRQAITAAGMGCAAALEAEKWIAQREGRAYPGKL